MMADLFGVGVPAIHKHLKNIFESGELDEAATISKMEMVRAEGDREVRRQVDFYIDFASQPARLMLPSTRPDMAAHA
jgi:hypothetical protein